MEYFLYRFYCLIGLHELENPKNIKKIEEGFKGWVIFESVMIIQ